MLDVRGVAIARLLMPLAGCLSFYAKRLSERRRRKKKKKRMHTEIK